MSASVASRCAPLSPSASFATTPKKLGATRAAVVARACSARPPTGPADSVPALAPAAAAFLVVRFLAFAFFVAFLRAFFLAAFFLCFLAAFLWCFLAAFLLCFFEEA